MTLLDRFPIEDPIWNYSNPRKVQSRANLFYGKHLILYRSHLKNKKYFIIDPNNGKLIHFGAMGMEDFTHHKDEKRRENYLKRSEKIKGDWEKNIFSPNNLSRRLLWNL